MREPALGLAGRHSPLRSPRPSGVVFRSVTANAHIHTDLLTPLGAYLRLREGAAASFLLESVEQGRLGRHSFIGSGSRLVSLRGGRGAGRPRSSATSPTTTSRSSSRRCRCPSDGPDLPESRFVVADTLVRFDHGSGTRRGARGRSGRRSRAGSSASSRSRNTSLRRSGDVERFPEQADVRGRRAADQGAHPRRRRVPGRALAARRAADLGLARSSSTGRCGASTRRRTSSCSSWTGSRSSARRPRRSSSARTVARA